MIHRTFEDLMTHVADKKDGFSPFGVLNRFFVFFLFRPSGGLQDTTFKAKVGKIVRKMTNLQRSMQRTGLKILMIPQKVRNMPWAIPAKKGSLR